jgi:lipopolysaccharide/colanic/teichoic acid biosynthesis glycosyltransferase
VTLTYVSGELQLARAQAAIGLAEDMGRIAAEQGVDELILSITHEMRGEMSLIGPRPERPEFIAELKEEIPFYEVRPGLSGWAQVRYRYGNT